MLQPSISSYMPQIFARCLPTIICVTLILFMYYNCFINVAFLFMYGSLPFVQYTVSESFCHRVSTACSVYVGTSCPALFSI